MSILFVVLTGIAMLITLGVLFAGVITMARGGEANRQYANRLMRARIIAQAVALALFAIAKLLSDKGG